MGYPKEGENSLLSYVKRSLSFSQEEAKLPGLDDRPRTRSTPSSPSKSSPLKAVAGNIGPDALEDDASVSAPSLSCPRMPAERADVEDAFDLADQLEKGLTKSIDFEQGVSCPVRRQKRLRRHCIFHLADPVDEYQLVSENGDLVLTAKFKRKDLHFDFFTSDPHPEKPALAAASSRPAFSMSYNESTHEWILVRSRCERCMHRPKHLTCDYLGKGQQMARIKYSRRPVGPKKIFVHHVEIKVPPLEPSGESAVWCPAEMGRDLGAREMPGSPSRRQASGGSSPGNRAWVRHILQRESSEPSCLHSRMPVWDRDLECLVLNFKSRHVEASPHNFMLCKEEREDCVSTSASSGSSGGSPDQSPSRDVDPDLSSPTSAKRAADGRKSGGESEEDAVIFQHAKMSGNTYCLDFNHPLSPVQAFAAAMASLTWT